MNNFDLKKFLVENKLTKASKDSLDEIEFRTVDRASLGNMEDLGDEEFEEDPSDIRTVDRQDFKQFFSKRGRKPTQSPSAALPGVGQGMNFLSFIKSILKKEIERLPIRSQIKNSLREELVNIHHFTGLEKWYNTHILGSKSIAEFYLNENEDITVTGDQPVHNEASKYLKHDSAQAILSELDNELTLAELEIKKEQIQKIVQEIESKISTLEEDAGMQGFVDKAAINEKRRVVKDLNKAYEQVNKLFEKMHAKYNKKKKK